VLMLSYRLSRRISLVARAGTENALDVVFSFAFD
jgi:autotransporter translocation and assembly factor TamB